MQSDFDLIKEFLEEKCLFEGEDLEEIIGIFSKLKIRKLDQLRKQSEEKLIKFGLTEFQASEIIEAFKNESINPSSVNEYSSLTHKHPQDLILLEPSVVNESLQIKTTSDTKSLVPQFQDKDTERFEIFETYEDKLSDHVMEKIRLNDSKFFELMARLKEAYQVVTVGFYGYFGECLKAVSQFLQSQINYEQDDYDGILMFRRDNHIALVYKTNDDIYNNEKNMNSKHLASTYIRYLVDLSDKIIVVTNETFQFNEIQMKSSQDHRNISFQFTQEAIQDQKGELSFQQIYPKSQNHSDNNLQGWHLTHDYQNKFIQVNISESNYEKIPIIDLRLLFHQDVGINSPIKDYQSLKCLILDNHQKMNRYFFYDRRKPDRFERNVDLIFSQFVTKNLKSEFQHRIRELQTESNKKHNEIGSKFHKEWEILIEDIYRKINGFFTNSKCNKAKQQRFFDNHYDQIQCQQHMEIWDQMNQENCVYFEHQNCQQMVFSDIIWNISGLNDNEHERFMQLYYKDHKQTYISVHYTYQNQMAQLFNEVQASFCQRQMQIGLMKKEKYGQLRFELLEKLFSILDNLHSSEQNKYNFQIKLEISELGVESHGKNQQWRWKNNIETYSYILGNQSSIHHNHIEIVKIMMINNNCGYLVVKDSPSQEKMFLYLFYLNSKKTKLELVQEFKSMSIELFINGKKESWITYDNKSQIVNYGEISKHYKLTNNKKINLYNKKIKETTITEIKSLVWTNKNKIILINQDGQICQYDINKDRLSLIKTTTEKESKEKEKQMKQKCDENNYFEISQTVDGKFYSVQNNNFIFFYDLNWELNNLIEKKNSQLVEYKYLIENNKNYILINYQDQCQLFHITGLKKHKQLKSEQIGNNEEDNNKVQNPILDYLNEAFKKFGPHSDFIGCPRTTELYLIVQNQKINLNIIQNYFNSLRLTNVTLILQNFENFTQQLPVLYQGFKFESNTFKTILLGRLAVHIATIDQGNLIPLNNGQNISNQLMEQLLDNEKSEGQLVDKLAEFIKFGIYENVIADLNSNIYTIAIAGKQSGGKSYVLNRFFGTRFNVAVSRCTDGIWMSLSVIEYKGEKKYFVILDCEGLFSQKRNEQEEIKLLLSISAISDIIIINQDISFTRNLTKLLNDFSKLVGRIKGSALFKGQLMMLVRDVNKDQSQAANKELEQTIMSATKRGENNFLKSLFNNKCIACYLTHYEQHHDFNFQIYDNRNLHFNSLNHTRWNNGIDFIQNFKLTLSQVFLDDDSDLDEHKIKIKCQSLYDKLVSCFINGGDIFDKIKETNYEIELTINEKTHIAHGDQKQLKLFNEINEEDQAYDEEKNDKIRSNHCQIISTFESQFYVYSQVNHNEWTNNYTKFIGELLNQRSAMMIRYFNEQLENELKDNEQYKQYLQLLIDTLHKEITMRKPCINVCQLCKRLCHLKYNHRENCTCGTEHRCKEICNLKEQCALQQNQCRERFGHEGEHRCIEGQHKCTSFCEIEDCKIMCALDIDHDENEKHTCGFKHSCNQQCENEDCLKTCTYDASIPHDAHSCDEKFCNKECEFCHRKCVFPNHLHQKLIDSKDTSKLSYSNEASTTEIVMDYHICQEYHQCPNDCTQKGICTVNYQLMKKNWETETSKFEFVYSQPLAVQKRCVEILEPLQRTHQGLHNCRQITFHQCEQQCPECKSYCTLQVNHVGYHKTASHRNKENNIFISTNQSDKIQIKDGGQIRQYKVGDSCQPETCAVSCFRKGPAHTHIKQCNGKSCKKNRNIRHSSEKYYPYYWKTFDQLLCEQYWKSLGWLPPLKDDELEYVKGCNYYCPHPSHKLESRKLPLCIKDAWHEDEHKICKHTERNQATEIDIVFCCDTTGSMNRYILETKTTMKRIIKVMNGQGKSLKFGFIGYKDHSKFYVAGQKVTECFDLDSGDILKQFISKIKCGGGGGDGPEAVMDGLYDSVKSISWRQKSQRYIFHICDSPPHGTPYNKIGYQYDNFKDGCPCGITVQQISQLFKSNKINYKLFKIGQKLNKMGVIFERYFDEYEDAEISDAVELVETITEIIIRDLQTNEFDTRKIQI